jgi:hypothetical protein
MSTEVSVRSKRRWLKRIVIAFAVLVVLVVVFLFSADGYRRLDMKDRAARLEIALARVDSKILKGQTPAQWQTSRVKGSNGWEHIARVRAAYKASRDWDRSSWEESADAAKPTDVTLWETIEAMCAWHDGEWYGDNPDDLEGESNRTPPPELLETWLKTSRPLAEAYSLASACDTIVMVPRSAEPYPAGIAVIPNLQIAKAVIARCRILLDSGRDVQAWQELKAFSDAAAKYDAPLCLIDQMINVGTWSLCVEFVLARLIEGACTPEQAQVFCNWDGIQDMNLAAIEGEAVWIAANAKGADYALTSPTMFDWITNDVPCGTGMFAMHDQFGSVRSRYFGPGNFAVEIAMAVENAVICVEIARTPQPWSVESVPVVEPSMLFAFYPSAIFHKRNNLVEKSFLWLELEARILELSQGPLEQRKDAVAALVAKYPGVVHDWDGGDLCLDIDSEWKASAASASAKDPESSGDLDALQDVFRGTRARLADSDTGVRIRPISELRASSEEGD